MKKLFAALLAVLTVISTASISFAANPTDNAVGNNFEIIVETPGIQKTVIDLARSSRYEELANGQIIIHPGWSSSEHTISVGGKMWYTGNGSGIFLNRGTIVTFNANFNNSISFACGYSGAGYNTIGTGTAPSFSTNIMIPADGTYKFYITNNSSRPVTVKSGSITY